MTSKEKIQKLDAALRKYKQGKANLERRVVEAENWWRLRNETEEQKNGVNLADGFKAKSAWLHNVIVSKHADAMESYPEPIVLPREPGDQAEAKKLSSILPVILEENGFESVYSAATWQKLKTGTAVYKVIWDADKLNGLGDVSVLNVDLLSVYWEPGVSDIQKGRYFFHVELQDNDLLEAEYPQLRGKLGGQGVTITRFLYEDNVDTSEKSAVVDAYYKVKVDGKTVLHYCKYVGDEILYETEPSDREDVSLPESEQAQSWGTQDGQTPALGTEQTADSVRGQYDDGEYPYVFDALFPIEGSPCGYGYVDICWNSQTQIDLLDNAFLRNTLVGATPRFFMSTGTQVDEKDVLDLTKPIIKVTGPVDEKAVKQFSVNYLAGAYSNFYSNKVQELRETSGNTESATGSTPAGMTAASAIAALQEASGKTSRDATKSAYRAFRRIVTMVIERIRQFYTLPRMFRITGEQGEEQFVQYDNSGLAPQPLGGIPGAGIYGDTDLGMRKPVLDVHIEAAKQNAYTRTAQNDLALQLYKLGVFNPQMADQSLALLDMMDFEGKDRLTQTISRNGTMMQQIMMLQQQIAALSGGMPGMGAPGQPAPGAPAEPVKIRDEAAPAVDAGSNPILNKARARSAQTVSL